MDIDILSLFPEYFEGPFSCSMIKRAAEKLLVNIQLVDIRSFAKDRHSTVDDRPYGGGPGMILKVGPIVDAIRSLRRERSHVIYLSPQGRLLDAITCESMALSYEHLILLCGHYEGIDERAINLEVDEEISIGNYVLTSGCTAAIVFVDAISRFIPGVIGNSEAVYKDSFHVKEGFDNPHYTRPAEFEGLVVPDVLVGGNHMKIEAWRKEKALAKRNSTNQQ